MSGALQPRRKAAQTKEEFAARMLEITAVKPKTNWTRPRKLTEAQAEDIILSVKRYYELREEMRLVSPAALAKKHGVAETTVDAISRGITWKALNRKLERGPQ